MKKPDVIFEYLAIFMILLGPVIVFYWDPLSNYPYHRPGEFCELLFLWFANESLGVFLATLAIRSFKFSGGQAMVAETLFYKLQIYRATRWIGLLLAFLFALGSAFYFLLSIGLSS